MKFRTLKYLFFAFIITAFISCGSGGSSDSDDDPGNAPISSSGINLNTDYDETIESLGTKTYKFQTTTAGNYTISLTNMTTNCGWTLCSYDPADITLNDLLDNIIDDTNGDQYGDTTDEINIESLDASTTYYLVIDEYDDNPSSYTLNISH
jgi:hypothetical protein